MMRFAQRLTGDFNVRVKKLIKIGTTNIVDMTNNNPEVTTTGPVFASKAINATGSCKRYVSPFKLLSIPAIHSTARINLTSSRFLAVALFVFIFDLLFLIDIGDFHGNGLA
jgi:hypothetical protein